MTREEAIAFGNRVIDLGFRDETQAFCEMAIKALELEPCEDCISRTEAIKIVSPYCDGDLIADDIKCLSPVTPTRNVGKWIGDKSYPICPKCNCNIIEEYISCSDYAEMYKPMKYCPNCGAKMEGEVEE